MSRSFAIRAAAALLLALTPWLAAQADSAALQPEFVARAVAVIDGDTVALADGREVRLVGIQAPKLPLGRKGFVAWPLAEEAKAALAQLALGHELGLAFGGQQVDRHRRLLAHLYDEESLWIQGALLERGMARVYTFHDNTALVSEMLAREAAAREAGRGIWAHPFYALRDPWTVSDDAGSFQLVEGRVMAAEAAGGRFYLNFGEDWREDFTVALDRDALRRFAAGGHDPTTLAGRFVRVRGWVRSFNGPLIDVTHPEQIEVLDHVQ